jgi:hypothetical protein
MNVKKKKPKAIPVPADPVDPKFSPVVDAFARDKQVTRSKMFGSLGLKVNGKVFVVFYKERFVAKLPAERVAALIAKGGAEYFDPGHGRTSKEWIAMAGASSSWIDLAKEAYGFVKEGQ